MKVLLFAVYVLLHYVRAEQNVQETVYNSNYDSGSKQSLNSLGLSHNYIGNNFDAYMDVGVKEGTSSFGQRVRPQVDSYNKVHPVNPAYGRTAAGTLEPAVVTSYNHVGVGGHPASSIPTYNTHVRAAIPVARHVIQFVPPKAPIGPMYYQAPLPPVIAFRPIAQPVPLPPLPMVPSGGGCPFAQPAPAAPAPAPVAPALPPVPAPLPPAPAPFAPAPAPIAPLQPAAHIDPAFGSIGTGITNLAGNIATGVSDLVNAKVQTGGRLVTGIADGVSNLVNTKVETGGRLVQGLAAGVGSGLTAIAGAKVEALSGIGNAIGTSISQATQGLANGIQGLRNLAQAGLSIKRGVVRGLTAIPVTILRTVTVANAAKSALTNSLAEVGRHATAGIGQSLVAGIRAGVSRNSGGAKHN